MILALPAGLFPPITELFTIIPLAVEVTVFQLRAAICCEFITTVFHLWEFLMLTQFPFNLSPSYLCKYIFPYSFSSEPRLSSVAFSWIGKTWHFSHLSLPMHISIFLVFESECSSAGSFWLKICIWKSVITRNNCIFVGFCSLIAANSILVYCQQQLFLEVG